MAIGNKIRIDLEGQRDINAGFELSTGDVNAYGLVLEFYKGNKQFDATGYNLVVYAKRSGSNIPIPDVGKIVDGKGYYVIKPSMYSTAGSTQIEIVLTDVLGMAFTPKVLSFDVRKGFASESGQLDEEDYSVLANLIQASQTAISQTESAIEYANTQGQYAKAMGDEAASGKLQFVIAPHNAVNKNRADLVLTGINDIARINEQILYLKERRDLIGDGSQQIRIDFMGGEIICEKRITLYSNMSIYGNNTLLNANVSLNGLERPEAFFSVMAGVDADNVTIDGFRMYNLFMGQFNEGYTIYIRSGRVSNCSIGYEGGIIYAPAICIEEEGRVENCEILCNNANNPGAAAIMVGNGRVADCNVEGRISRLGAGIRVSEGEVRNCRVRFARGTDGIRVVNGDITDCNIVTCGEIYDGIAFYVSNGNISNCTISNLSSKATGFRVNTRGMVSNCTIVSAEGLATCINLLTGEGAATNNVINSMEAGVAGIIGIGMTRNNLIEGVWDS